MAFLPLSAVDVVGDAWVNSGAHRPGPSIEKVLAAMTLLVLLLFLALLGAASAAGLTVDSRDGADWTATVDGRRQSRSVRGRASM
jgi:hypothetical protein